MTSTGIKDEEGTRKAEQKKEGRKGHDLYLEPEYGLGSGRR